MLAITLGIYQKLIDSINNFFKHPKENFKFLSKISIGVIISIVFFSNIILKSLNKHYLITVFFFIGLIIGGFENIRKNTDKGDRHIAVISFIFVFILGMININNEISIQNNFIYFIYFIFIGFVDAITAVIPGISGTATLMMLGAYTTLIKTFSTIFDFYYIKENLIILIPFIIGFGLGIIITAKIVQYLFKNKKEKTYSSILGFSIGTIALMFLKSLNSFYTIEDLLIAILMLFAGLLTTKRINHLFNG